MTPPIKPGIKTSEFWITWIPSLLALFAAAGVIGPNDVSPIVENVKTVVLGIFSLASIINYVRGRFDLKKQL